jgi:hypothetical protein
VLGFGGDRYTPIVFTLARQSAVIAETEHTNIKRWGFEGQDAIEMRRFSEKSAGTAWRGDSGAGMCVAPMTRARIAKKVCLRPKKKLKQ